MRLTLLTLFAVTCLSACGQPQNTKSKPTMSSSSDKLQTIYLGEGCFWCTEAFFQRINGVISVESGYGGGFVENPTYEQVCDKNTGHVEIAKIVFDPAIVPFKDILEVFWKTHDPTTLDRQGNDVGPQYKSVIYYVSEAQKTEALAYKEALDKSGAFDAPIVTTIEPFKNYYPAENYHQNYYNSNTNQGYCSFVIAPKLEKFDKVFKDKLKH
ncbi:MAG: peptide-methionine (S)-S-oxide reductase MsrA [Bacteroidetes bacterium]|nr:peptide-methionine (S)-S-oxide reductase MsrA [Bacteroidota bacterium]